MYNEDIKRKKLDAAKTLFHWQCNGSDCFTAKLFELMLKADTKNRSRLGLAFPVEAAVLAEWQLSTTPSEFYRYYGIIKEDSDETE